MTGRYQMRPPSLVINIKSLIVNLLLALQMVLYLAYMTDGNEMWVYVNGVIGAVSIIFTLVNIHKKDIRQYIYIYIVHYDCLFSRLVFEK